MTWELPITFGLLLCAVNGSLVEDCLETVVNVGLWDLKAAKGDGIAQFVKSLYWLPMSY